MDTTLNPAPAYYIIESVGGMHEGYSDTTCRILDSPAQGWSDGKTKAEQYIDQWMREMNAFYKNLAHEWGIALRDDLRFKHEACKDGVWHKVYPDLDQYEPTLSPDDFNSCHTLVIYGALDFVNADTVIVYDQAYDRVDWVVPAAQAMHLAEEAISLEVERLKQSLYEEETDPKLYTHYVNSLIFCYDCLAEVVRDIESGTDVMLDIDDTCTHYFPVKHMKPL